VRQIFFVNLAWHAFVVEIQQFIVNDVMDFLSTGESFTQPRNRILIFNERTNTWKCYMALKRKNDLSRKEQDQASHKITCPFGQFIFYCLF